jgi:hypothetical protein
MSLTGTRRTVLLAGAASAGADPATLAFVAAVAAAGGSVSAGRRALINQTIDALKASGDWNNIDDLMVYAAENQAQALVSWKLNLVGAPVNSPVFTADRCLITDGVTQYVDTGFIPAAHATRMTGTDQAIGVYEVTNLSANSYAAGAVTTNFSGMRVNPRVATTASVQANFTTTALATTPTSDGRGLTSAYRTPAPVYGGAKNCASLGTVTPANNAAGLVALNVFVGGVSGSGNVLQTARATNCGYLVLGRSAVALSGTFYSILQSHLSAIGGAV